MWTETWFSYPPGISFQLFLSEMPLIPPIPQGSTQDPLLQIFPDLPSTTWLLAPTSPSLDCTHSKPVSRISVIWFIAPSDSLWSPLSTTTSFIQLMFIGCLRYYQGLVKGLCALHGGTIWTLVSLKPNLKTACQLMNSGGKWQEQHRTVSSSPAQIWSVSFKNISNGFHVLGIF